MGRRKSPFDPFIQAIGNAIARQILVVMKKKKPCRGGVRISQGRNLVDPRYNRRRDSGNR